jgi:predicted alpha-1,6-mannanase (GH76 family)
LFLVAGVGPLLLVLPTRAVTPAEADLAFHALNTTYWDPAARLFRKEERGGKKADFWLAAQLWDTVMDQYDRTGSADVKGQIDDAYDGFVKVNRNWTTNKFNDDIMWWAIACGRAYVITHNERYLTKSKASFDFVYNKFTDDRMGGGVYWSSDRTYKSSCVNGPTVIAAARLALLLNDPTYLEKAKSVYAWQKKTLSDGKGKVFDGISPPNKVNRGSLTYNQGTFIGAAVVLYQQTKDTTYLDDAVKAAEWTKAHLCVTDERILRSEGQGDGGAFKGIFVRYMKRLIQDGGRTEFLPWMKANADAAWRHRRPADNIMGDDWSAPTGQNIQSQTAASAAAVVIDFADEEPAR